MTTANLVTNTGTPVLSPEFLNDTQYNKQPVLLVEDDGALRRYLQLTLERNGFEVITARDGLDATNKLMSHSFSLVVTDAMMPRMTGYDLCRFVRRNEKLSSLPVILLSGLDHDDWDNEQSSEERANVYLSKPVSPDDLVCHLKQLLPGVL